jgi:uridine monophosphate synthetase
MTDTPDISHLSRALYQLGALQFGEFKLKSGLLSPIYVDMRLLVSDPAALELVAEHLYALTVGLTYDRLAAIPYAALPIGVALSLRARQPLVYPRKERKAYGTGRPIEGHYIPGEHVLLIDDVITRGDSKIEAVETMREAGLIVEHIAVLLDREGGGVEMLQAQGFQVHAALTLTALLNSLREQQLIDADQVSTVRNWLVANR